MTKLMKLQGRVLELDIRGCINENCDALEIIIS